MFLRLVEAISLHRKGLLYGAEYLVFPPVLNSRVFPPDIINELKALNEFTTPI
ncbi:MAG: hypothetical protein KME46_19190 [Brasilonema angustatum HA4187-MV1]|jgi:hypothetical protein|nr:hypothetical protein [Brasilonema sp. CT11]MBW4594969.1 hypothetical protein [Brasilonema angustatum HA4187-MV1]